MFYYLLIPQTLKMSPVDITHSMTYISGEGGVRTEHLIHGNCLDIAYPHISTLSICSKRGEELSLMANPSESGSMTIVCPDAI